MAQKVDGIEIEIKLDSDQYVKDLDRAEKESEKSAKEIQKDLEKANETIRDSFTDMADGIGNAFLAVSGAIATTAGTIGGFALNSLMDMDGAMSQLQASTGATNEAMEEFEEVAKNVYGNNYGEDWDDVANAIAEVNKQLWLQGEELQTVTEQAFTIRDVFGADVPESVRAAKTLVKQFGVTGEEAMNLITQGYQANLDYSGEFLDSINEYSPQFQQLGFDVEDMFNIFYNGATDGAFSLDKVGDAVKEFGIRTQDMSDTTRNAYKTLGLDIKKTEKAFAEGGEAGKKAFDDVIKGIEGIEDPLKRNEVGVQLFGTMWEDLGEDVIFSLNDMSDNFNRTVDSATELTEVKYDNIGSAFAGIKRQIEVGALIPIGEKLLPLMNDFAKWLNEEGIPKIVEFAESFGNKLAGAVESIMPYMDEFAGILGYLLDNITWIVPLLVGLGGAFKGLSFIGTITPLISAVSGAIASAGGVTAALSGAFTFLTGPIGLVIGAVVLLVTAWTTNFGGMRDFTSDIFNSIKDIIGTIFGAIKRDWDNDFLGIRTICTAAWENIKLTFNTVLTIISGVVKVFSLALKGDWSGALNVVKETASKVWSNIKQIFSNSLNAVVTVVRNIAGALSSAATASWNKIKEAATKSWNTMMNWFKGAIKDPVGTIKGIGSSLYSAGRDMINSVWDGCKSIWTSVTNWFSDKVNWIRDKLAFWRSSQAEMNRGGSSGGSGGGRTASYSRGAFATGYAMAGVSNSTTNVTFSGTYSFAGKSDIDYFMNEAGRRLRKQR